VDFAEQLSKQFSALFYLVNAHKSMERRRSEAPQSDIRHTPRPLDLDQAGELAGAFLAGVEVKQLAKMYGIDRSTVLTHLRRFGVRRRRTKLNGSDIDRVVELYAKGWTIAAIASEIRVGATTVRRALIKAEVEIRRRGRRT
jgi:DNA invertase Pin-like site-specific DNA recombinase